MQGSGPPVETDADRFRTLIEHASDLLLEFGLDQRVSFASPSIERLLGYRPDEVLGRTILEFLDPLEAPRVAAVVEEAFANPSEPRSVEHRLLRKDGSWGVFESRGQALWDAAGGIRVVSISRDVSARKEAEQSHARLSLAVEQAAELIVITDPEAAIQYVNPAFERVTGYVRTEVLGKNPRMLNGGQQDPAHFHDLWDTLKRREVWRGEFTNRRKDGSLYQVEATISPVQDPTGRLMGYVGVERDVTHEKRLEEQLLRAQKMEAVGRLAGGIAHDFNNLLGVITGYGELLLRHLGDLDPQRVRAEQLLKAADRAATLTRQLLAFSRQQVLQPKVLDLNVVIGDLEKMLRRVIGEDVAFSMAPGESLGCVRADPSQIEQVLMNLVVNARDAMPRGGRLTIETTNVDLTEAYTREHAVVQPGPYVMLAVSDTGCGMDPRTLEQVFEPFFTTKEPGKGTGLGLSTVYGIVKQSGGYVWAYSELGRGTTFKIYLPRVDEPVQVTRTTKAPLHVPRGTERVLLVEDDTMLRDLLEETLTAHGYSVRAAKTGGEALEAVAHSGETFDLLVTDMVLPGISGREAAGRLTAARPGLRVLYVSGYAADAIVEHGELPASAAFLGKPFSPDALLRKVREVLDGT